MYGAIGEECWQVTCKKTATHVLTTTYKGMANEVAYCLEDAVYFAGWLPYCYPGEHELVSITPPASELFGK